jgi:hypothetical protein
MEAPPPFATRGSSPQRIPFPRSSLGTRVINDSVGELGDSLTPHVSFLVSGKECSNGGSASCLLLEAAAHSEFHSQAPAWERELKILFFLSME